MSEAVLLETLYVPSTPAFLPQVVAEVERVATEQGFSADACADLSICVSEACSNAIVHAHRERADMAVAVAFERLPDGLRVRVRDHGGGFDADLIPDPTQPENLLKITGRGLFLIRALMDAVEVRRHPDGTEILMIKHCGGRA